MKRVELRIDVTASEAPPGRQELAATSAVIGHFAYPFHWEGVPNSILDGEVATGYPHRKVNPPFGSAAEARG